MAHKPANHMSLRKDLADLHEYLTEFESDITAAEAREKRMAAPAPDDDVIAQVRAAQQRGDMPKAATR